MKKTAAHVLLNCLISKNHFGQQTTVGYRCGNLNKVQFGVKNPCYCYPVTNDIVILKYLSTEERLWKP